VRNNKLFIRKQEEFLKEKMSEEIDTLLNDNPDLNNTTHKTLALTKDAEDEHDKLLKRK